MLEMLVRNRGKLVGREELLREVWGPAYAKETHYLRVYLAQLRRKLEDDPSPPVHLLTDAGMGYRIPQHRLPRGELLCQRDQLGAHHIRLLVEDEMAALDQLQSVVVSPGGLRCGQIG